MRKIAADGAGLRRHGNRFQPHAGEGAQVGHEHPVVGLARILLAKIEGIGVLHEKFAAPHHAEARPDLVAELPLDMIEDARQVLVGLHRVAEDRRDQLLIGWSVEHFALVSVRDAQHLFAIVLIAATFPPQLGALDSRHEELDRAGAVLLLAYDLLDLAENAIAQRQPGIDTGARLADKPGAQHQPVGDDFRFLGIVAQEWQEIAAEAHWQLFGV